MCMDLLDPPNRASLLILQMTDFLFFFYAFMVGVLILLSTKLFCRSKIWLTNLKSIQLFA